MVVREVCLSSIYTQLYLFLIYASTYAYTV